ncbi:MAG: hypothetical protein K1X65_13785 [Caldilineales bacterium]|nr:hypothetical protein [Caldilineales bacterium]MCW5857880.1 hypothetical protein [Caldilineales bacterium]
MSNLPITHMTLYKHGVGFFQRRAALSGDKVDLTFRVAEMNDVLKSLTAIDWGAGQVLGVEYATPQSREERLAGCSIRLSDARSLGDLLVGLRGRRVTLLLDQGEAANGALIGLDEAPERQPLASALVSLLAADGQQVRAFALGRVQGVDIEDERGAGDLRFFLDTALSPETHRLVSIRLTPGEHDLSVSYVAPAPTWRVSYRLVVEGERALLQGWGVFDNRLEEDLQGISLALVAGMPISFVYDLYTPFTPARPEVKEEGRVAAQPVEFDQALGSPPSEERSLRMAAPMTMAAPTRGRASLKAEAIEAAAPAQASGKDLGELFQYDIATPVTVGRGQSAMAPILAAWLPRRKDLIYNPAKFAKHPVATLRLRNETGLTLERGPATVIEDGAYVGEALLPFTAEGGEIVAPYAVELGAKLREESGQRREMRALRIEGAYLRVEEWEVRWRQVWLTNSTPKGLAVLVEHRRPQQYSLFETAEPKERTDEFLRFELAAAARAEASLLIQERRLVASREELQKQSYDNLSRYLQAGLIDQSTHDFVAGLLRLWEQVDTLKRRLGEVGAERDKIFKTQQQIQANMAALGQTGKEGSLRARYVDDLEASEAQLKALAQQEAEVQKEIERVEREIDQRIREAGH